jgi:teichuronic acid biosynthesis glycosyltransferase TuaC
MKIAQFISHFPYPDQFSNPSLARKYVCSGGEIAAYKLSVNLAKMGHSVHVYTSSVNGETKVENSDGLTIHRHGSWFEVGTTRIAPGLLFNPLRDRGMDIVHVQHTTPPGGAAGLAYAKYHRLPLIVTHHGFERFENYGSLPRKILVYLSANFFVDALFAQADRLIVVSPFFAARSRFLKKYGRKTETIPNGIDSEEYRTSLTSLEARKAVNLPPGSPVILFVGSLLPRKGVDVLLRAMQRIVANHPAAQLIILGQGPLRESLLRQAAALGVASHTHFQGFIGDPAQKALYYRAADVLAVPSLDDLEVFPLVLLEGSAAGCAIAASDLETFRVIARDGFNVVSAKAGDPESLAAGIRSIVENDRLKESLSRNAEENVKRFSWLQVAGETEALYRECIADREKGRRPIG